MNEIKTIAPGRVVTGPGAILADIDKQTRAHSGQELRSRPRPTTRLRSAASSPVAQAASARSISAACADFGNVLRLRVVTMEAEPKVLELTGEICTR